MYNIDFQDFTFKTLYKPAENGKINRKDKMCVRH